MARFYTYIHKRPNGDVVYVGKGCGDRAWSIDRSDPVHSRWMGYCVMYGADNVEVVDRFLTESEALKLESQMIEHYVKAGCKLFNKQQSWRTLR